MKVVNMITSVSDKLLSCLQMQELQNSYLKEKEELLKVGIKTSILLKQLLFFVD